LLLEKYGAARSSGGPPLSSKALYANRIGPIVDTAQSIGYLGGYIGFALYTGCRLGWWAKKSKCALDETMGLPSKIEKIALQITLLAGAIFLLCI